MLYPREKLIDVVNLLTLLHKDPKAMVLQAEEERKRVEAESRKERQ